MKKKITYIISDINRSVAFEWLFNALKHDLDISVILLNPAASELEAFLLGAKINVVTVICRGKRDWMRAFLKTLLLLKKWKPQIVHCHLMQASIIGLSAAWVANIKARVFTRHHSSEHHVYHAKGILWDKLCNRMATNIIAISPSVKQILCEWEGVAEKKVALIPHGFEIGEFQNVSIERSGQIKEKYGLYKCFPVIGVISRFVEWKGVQYIIPAFKQLLQFYPGAVLLLLNTKGDYTSEIIEMLDAVPEKSRRLILFEQDMPAVYHCMDVFVHVPINEHCEAFGQIYVEALASGVPAVYTLSGIAPTFVKDHSNALVVDYKKSDQIFNAMKEVLEDKSLNDHLRTNGPTSVSYFRFERYAGDLASLYNSLS